MWVNQAFLAKVERSACSPVQVSTLLSFFIPKMSQERERTIALPPTFSAVEVVQSANGGAWMTAWEAWLGMEKHSYNAEGMGQGAVTMIVYFSERL